MVNRASMRLRSALHGSGQLSPNIYHFINDAASEDIASNNQEGYVIQKQIHSFKKNHKLVFGLLTRKRLKQLLVYNNLVQIFVYSNF